MKSRLYMPFLVLAGLIILVGLACESTPTPTSPPPPPPQATTPPQTQPTSPPPPPPPTQPPPEAQPYFTEEFDGDISNWSYFLMKGDEDDMNLGTENGRLVFDLNGENLWVYVVYEAFSYKDVRIDVRADNRGKNTNNVSLICRYTEDEGWYEFNIANSGLYNILFYDQREEDYKRIYNGGSTAIRQGKDVNEYTAICKGNKLSLYINGQEVRTVEERKYALREGLVGVSVSSFDVLPIIVEFEWVTISQP